MVLRMNVCIFGNYYPHFEGSGTITSALSLLLAEDPRFRSITIHGNSDSVIPPVISPERVRLERSWTRDDPVSIIRAIIHMLFRSKTDLYIFNIYLTCFGRGRLTNFIGLLMPAIVSLVSRKKVITYMHNFLETQQIDKLGYKATLPTKIIVHIVEKVIAAFTTLVTTLPSMAREMERVLRRPVSYALIPYADATVSYLTNREKIIETLSKARTEPNILLFGSWGPQKDVIGLLEHLNSMVSNLESQLNFTVAGSINKNFPSYISLVTRCVSKLNSKRFRFMLDPSDDELPFIFLNADAIILPYFTSGGASGVLQLASFYFLDIFAYEVSELRELAQMINQKVTFIQPGDRIALSNILSNVRVRKGLTIDKFDEKVKRSHAAIDRLLQSIDNE